MSSGKGSIEMRDKDGYTWRLVVCNGYTKSGKKDRHKKTVHVEGRTIDSRRKAAERELALFLAEVEKTDYVEPSRYTVEDFVDKWLSDYASKNLKGKTYLRYKELLKGRFCQALGHKKLQDLKPVHLIGFYDNLQENGIRDDISYVAKPELIETIQSNKIDVHDLVSKAGISERTYQSILSGNPTTTAEKVCMAISSILSDKTENKKVNIKKEKLFSPSKDPKPLSNNTISHYHKAISSMLNDAMQWQLITTNPAARVKPPKVEKKDIQFLDEHQAGILLSAMESEDIKFRAIVHLALATGCRRGELVALRWSDLDMEKGTVNIKRSIQYIPGQGLSTKEPKNKSSIRIIKIPSSTISILRAYKMSQNGQKVKIGSAWLADERQKQGENFVDPEWIFTTQDGHVMHPDSISNWFPEFINRFNKSIDEDEKINKEDKQQYKLPNITFHSLRHSAASLLINKGLNVRALASRLGHANANTTLSIYAHAFMSADAQAADMMENILSGEKKSEAKQA